MLQLSSTPKEFDAIVRCLQDNWKCKGTEGIDNPSDRRYFRVDVIERHICQMGGLEQLRGQSAANATSQARPVGLPSRDCILLKDPSSALFRDF